MTFESKISGTKVTGFEIEPIFDTQFISLIGVIEKRLSQRTMDWILDTLRFSKGREFEGKVDWYATIDWDSIYKISILENYPNYEKEMLEHFGENWLENYIRFNH